MADLSLILLLVIIVFDFVVSLWNAYASGQTWALLRGRPGHTFEKVSAFAGVGLAFAGMSYVLLIVLSYVAALVRYISVDTFLFVVSFDFLVFGACIIGFGLVVTAESVAIAYRQRNFGAIAVAVWNVFSEIWDITIYAEGFRDAAGVVRADREDKASVAALAAVAVGFALLLTFIAFRQGVRKVEDAIAASPTQSAAENALPTSPAPHAHWTRRKVLAAIAAVVVVIAVIVALAVTSPGGTPSKVHVAFIDVWAPNNACGLNDHPVGYDGFDDAPGASEAFALQVHNFNSTGCEVHSVTTNTSGFGLSNVMVPVAVPAGGNATLNLTVLLPPSAFSGDLALIYA